MRIRVRLLALLALAACLHAEKPWWEQELLRIIDLGTSLSQIDFRPPAEVAARKAALGYNAEHLEIMGMPAGLDDQHFFFKSAVAGRQNRDYLGEYLPFAKRGNLRVMIYFNVHWYGLKFAGQHPDWRMTRENGQPLDQVYDTGADFCVNTPWRKWCFQVLKDLAAYPIDGIFYDGPVYRPDTCYCKYCREKYRARYGKEMPSKQVRRGPEFKNLVDFQAASLAEFLRDSRAVLKAANPNVALYMNGGVRGSNWATGRLNRVLVEHQDMLGSEGGFLSGDLTHVPLWKPGLTARLLETQAGGKPRVIFSAAGHKPWTFSLLPAPELRLLYASSIANASGVWFGLTPFEFDQPEMQTLAEMNRFLEKNKEYYQDTRSEARVAVVWSETTANFYAGSDAQLIDIDRVAQTSNVGNLEAEFSGISEALLRAHVPFDVIDDVRLEKEPIERYQAIFLPNVACMSEAVARRLREYVRAGGRVFSTFETSLYDDTGIRREQFALGDVLGVRDKRAIAGPRRWDFMKPTGTDPLLEGLQREFVPSPAYYVRVDAAGARSLLRFTKPLAGRYDGVPGISEDAALLVNTFGKGLSIYSPGDLGAAIAGFHIPELLRLVDNAAASMAPPPFELRHAPGSVEAVLRSQNGGKRLLLHLVNFNGEMTRPITRTTPLTEAEVILAGGPVRSAHTLMSPRKLEVKRESSGRIRVTLPRIQEYEVVVFER